MEKVISSSAAPASSHRCFSPCVSSATHPHSSAAARSGLLLLRKSGFKPAASLLLKRDGRRSPCRQISCSFSFLHNFPFQTLGAKRERSCFATRSPVGRDLAVTFLAKVASAAVLVLLSAVTVTLIQAVFAQPVHAIVHSATTNVRSELLSSAWTGLFAGCLHTLSGADHLAALAPLSIGRTRIESAMVGALWGCGHDTGQMIFGLLFLLLKDRLHIEIIRTWGTRVVGITLLIIGAMGIREASDIASPCVALEDGECDVSISETVQAINVGKKKVGFATFATGIVHGLQPDALMMILPALALPSRLAGAAFLGMFLVGTVLAMGAYTVFIGSCSQALKERIPRITEKLTWAASLLAIFMGLAILLSQSFGFSLY
ncbi:hypothetical protein HPP92_020725 [Vanilla planifolia]|uniref:Urease accessory protein UreH-like transmembrane domain-containing protein n=1 Tax=Vanilla planifolia TaxID=51239 RepID=A0A835Q0J2_VANPL|nr:hypothetical protein HPP92_020725 [Vanilla planifolia]